MKIGWRYLVTFVVGVAVGGIAAGAFVGRHWQRSFASWYVLGVADQANVAAEVLSGRGTELAGRIQASLPAYVSALRGELGDTEGADWALWRVSDVYAAAGATPPPELRAVFESLPPRASCKRPPAAPGGPAASR